MFGLTLGRMGAGPNYGKIGAAWTPADLFANDEKGVWYDPSDLTTMFQDSIGTTPVTADGQPVGLILDKSKGLALGPELIVNGTFDTNATGWTPSNSTLASVSGELQLTAATASYPTAKSTVFNCTVGKSYLVVVTGRRGTCTRNAACGIASMLYDRMFSSTTNDTKSFIFTATGTTHQLNCYIAGGDVGVGQTAYFDSISVRELLGNHASQATAAARPLYKTDGTYHWLQFDGVDDCLSTSAIDFTSTNKVTIFAGVEKKTNPAQIICELGPNINTTTRTFYVVSGADAVDTGYSTASRGTASMVTGLVATIGTFLLVNRGVLSCTHDIPADLSRIRRNTVDGIDGTADKGSGNFENMPLNIGARNGSSLIFNGNIYSLIVRGVLSTSQEITGTETWVNRKTGAY